MRSADRRDEGGVTIVVLALSISALILVVMLIVDGGRAYAARRDVQNASDSAALAGAQALYTYQYAVFTGASANSATIIAAVNDKLTQNRATDLAICDFVTAGGTPTGNSCSSGVTTGAVGVRVKGSTTQNLSFPARGLASYTAKATSTATAQPLVGMSNPPFIVCGSSTQWPILKSPVAGQPAAINVDLAYAAGTQPLQSSQVPTCGAGAAFKGKAGMGGTISVDPNDGSCAYPCGYGAGDNGNGYSISVFNAVTGAVPCPTGLLTSPTLNCDMLLPIADSGFGNGTTINMHIVAYGIFHVTGNGSGNPKYYASFVKPASLATGGVGAAGRACNVGSDVCLVKLIS